MEIQQLRHFLAVVECGTISAAAEATNITQSGLSRSLRNLENTLGLPLIKRNPRGVVPTPFGEMLLARAKLIVNENDRAVDDLRAIRLAKAGVIKLGMTPNFALYFASDVVAKFAATRPNVDFQIVSASTATLIDLLMLGELDFAVGLLVKDFDLPEQLKAETLFESSSLVFSSNTHPLTALAAVTIGELAKERWAIIDSTAFIAAFNAYFKNAGYSVPRIVIRTNSIAFLLRCMDRQDLLTVLPAAITTNPMAKSLVELKSKAPAAEAQAKFIYRSEELLLTPAVKDLIHTFRQEAANGDLKQWSAIVSTGE